MSVGRVVIAKVPRAGMIVEADDNNKNMEETV
jgi:hypothetical protein